MGDGLDRSLGQARFQLGHLGFQRWHARRRHGCRLVLGLKIEEALVDLLGIRRLQAQLGQTAFALVVFTRARLKLGHSLREHLALADLGFQLGRARGIGACRGWPGRG